MANSVAHQKAANSVRRTTPAVHSCFAWMGQVVENSRHKLHTTFREKQKLRTRQLPSTTKAMESTPPLTASSSVGGSHRIAPQGKIAEDVAAEAPRSPATTKLSTRVQTVGLKPRLHPSSQKQQLPLLPVRLCTVV